MEELYELRTALEERRYADALRLIEEMEQMSRDDKINQIDRSAVALLVDLIKQQVERRTTRAWDLCIYTAVRQIKRINERRRSGNTYLSSTELQQIITEAFPAAVKTAAIDIFEGQWTEKQLLERVNRKEIERRALAAVISENG